jgi:hypothetical protein
MKELDMNTTDIILYVCLLVAMGIAAVDIYAMFNATRSEFWRAYLSARTFGLWKG